MTRIEQMIGTASEWSAANPVLRKGEVGWEQNAQGISTKGKVGDGITAWNSLPYTVMPFDSAIVADKAPLNSPVFTGDPRVPTPTTADSDTSVANTLWVKNQGYATTASPTLTGDPKAPTPAAADNDDSIATTKFVKDQGYATKTTAEAITNKDLTSLTNTFPPMGLVQVVTYNTSGSFIKANYPGLKAIRVRVVGGGGGAGGCALTTATTCATGGPGGGGGYAEKFIAASSLAANETVTVGGGGASGTGVGTAGAGSAFGTFASASGGNPGGAGTAVAPPSSLGGNAGSGGSGTGGDINIDGGSGMDSFALNTSRAFISGGGASYLGTRNRDIITGSSGNGIAGTGYGNGGSGAANTANQAAARPGGAGSAGIVIVEIYK